MRTSNIRSSVSIAATFNVSLKLILVPNGYRRQWLEVKWVPTQPAALQGCRRAEETPMHAQIMETLGEPDMFRAATLPRPQPGTGEVVVALAATSVNSVHDKVRCYGPSMAPRLTSARRDHHQHREPAADRSNSRRRQPFMGALPIIGRAARPVAVLTVVLSLGACVSSPNPSIAASVDECRTGTLREIQHFGPPSRSAPPWGMRKVRVCEPAGASPNRVRTSR